MTKKLAIQCNNINPEIVEPYKHIDFKSHWIYNVKKNT